MSTPLTTAIQNLTASANTTTGASDTTLSSAVSRLISGYGGGGGSTLITKSITANGTYDASDDSADGYSQVSVNVPTGSTNFVTGTFTGTTAGERLSVTVPYTGSGYPIAIVVYPSEGTYNTEGTVPSLLCYRGVVQYAAVKNELTTTPTYSTSTTENNAMVNIIYKSNASTADTVSTSSNKNTRIYTTGTANAYSTDMLHINSATQLNVIMANDAYGFIPNIEYTYRMIYSS